jgi:hypothetical protein
VPGSAAGNIEQHHAFHTGLAELERYLTLEQSDPSKNDGGKVTNMFDQFGDVLVQHLNDEIHTLDPQ